MKPKRQGRPPVIENARDRILDDAARLFAREGYEGTSLGDVADAIGATKAAIYHYFPNKKDIYEAIIVRTLDGLLRSVSAATTLAAGPEEKLAKFMTAHADFFENNYDGFLAMLVGYGGMQNVVMIAEAQRLRDSYEHALRQWLRYYNEDRPHGAIGNKPPILSDAITYYSVTIPPTYSVVDLDDQRSQQGGIQRCAKLGDNAVHFGEGFTSERAWWRLRSASSLRAH